MSTILHACQVYIYIYIIIIIACIIVIIPHGLYTLSPVNLYTWCYVIPANASNQSFIKNVNCTVFMVSYYLLKILNYSLITIETNLGYHRNQLGLQVNWHVTAITESSTTHIIDPKNKCYKRK